MIKILFVCHGNICRSVMGHYMLQDLVDKQGLAHDFVIDSAACRNDEIGNPIYPPARTKLQQEGVAIGTHRARRLTSADIHDWDVIIGMDEENMRDMNRMFGMDHDALVVKAMELVGESRDVADPWYTGDFDATYNDLQRVCLELLRRYEAGQLLEANC